MTAGLRQPIEYVRALGSVQEDYLSPSHATHRKLHYLALVSIHNSIATYAARPSCCSDNKAEENVQNTNQLQKLPPLLATEPIQRDDSMPNSHFRHFSFLCGGDVVSTSVSTSRMMNSTRQRPRSDFGASGHTDGLQVVAPSRRRRGSILFPPPDEAPAKIIVLNKATTASGMSASSFRYEVVRRLRTFIERDSSVMASLSLPASAATAVPSNCAPPPSSTSITPDLSLLLSDAADALTCMLQQQAGLLLPGHSQALGKVLSGEARVHRGLVAQAAFSSAKLDAGDNHSFGNDDATNDGGVTAAAVATSRTNLPSGVDARCWDVSDPDSGAENLCSSEDIRAVVVKFLQSKNPFVLVHILTTPMAPPKECRR